MQRTLRLTPLLALLTLGACRSEAPIVTATPTANTHASAQHGASHATAQLSPEVRRQLAEVRQVTAPFQNFERAAAAGYGTAITPCWENREQGGMGYHYGNTALLDGTVSLLEPEVLMYEPGPNGQMRLVGLEYIVPIEAWPGDTPPTLFGQDFHPHSFLPIYKLHVWLWKDNPRGIFADWNPTVSCRHAAESEYF